MVTRMQAPLTRSAVQLTPRTHRQIISRPWPVYLMHTHPAAIMRTIRWPLGVELLTMGAIRKAHGNTRLINLWRKCVTQGGKTGCPGYGIYYKPASAVLVTTAALAAAAAATAALASAAQPQSAAAYTPALTAARTSTRRPAVDPHRAGLGMTPAVGDVYYPQCNVHSVCADQDLQGHCARQRYNDARD